MLPMILMRGLAQHVNDFDQAWPYNTQFREMSRLRRGEIGIRDTEFHDAVKLIMILRISQFCLRREYKFVVLECCIISYNELIHN
jgi:hypothetical protein